jgi:23S rRNA (cytidine1920-2'-O)/16S rRNA (cytidine1409-2'-O)-methyltransferase
VAKKGKGRLDELVVESGLAQELTEARALIGTGRIFINGQRADKAGNLVDRNCTPELKGKKRFVSRAGEKLAAGLHFHQLDPTGWICADIGCSTGGFTDCLLQKGAQRIYSVDVGYGLLDWNLRRDDRVVVLERTNARNLTEKQIPDPLDLAVVDVSFISLGLVRPPLIRLFGGEKRILALVKPQFELGREQVSRGGVVTDPVLHEEAVSKVAAMGQELGLKNCGVTASPVKGTKGNQEFIIYLYYAGS